MRRAQRNKLLESLYKDPSVEIRTRVRFYVERWTLGQGVERTTISQVRMAKEMNLNRRNLQHILKRLVKIKRLTRSPHKPLRGKSPSYGLNLDTQSWV